VPDTWLNEHLENDSFTIYYNVPDRFYNMAERVVARDDRDFEWYKQLFGLDVKISMGTIFIEKHQNELELVTSRNGIPYELVVAILGMETNFADSLHKGKYYVFNTLVTQYLLMPKREKFALRQLEYLYRFSQRTNTSVFYYIGSFAGACGWAQFIPSSLEEYYIDARDNDEGIDIYDLNDTLHSIENYLYNHGLNGGTSWLLESRYNAVYAYNHSYAYVDAVLYIYDDLIRKSK